MPARTARPVRPPVVVAARMSTRRSWPPGSVTTSPRICPHPRAHHRRVPAPLPARRAWWWRAGRCTRSTRRTASGCGRCCAPARCCCARVAAWSWSSVHRPRRRPRRRTSARCWPRPAMPGWATCSTSSRSAPGWTATSSPTTPPTPSCSPWPPAARHGRSRIYGCTSTCWCSPPDRPVGVPVARRTLLAAGDPDDPRDSATVTGASEITNHARHRAAAAPPGPEGLSVWATAQLAGPSQRRGRYVPESVRHPARMLPAIAAHAIASYTRPGDLVLDPMCGIGTTLVEAVHAGRDAIGVEYESRWADIADANLARAHTRGVAGHGAVIRGDATLLSALLPTALHGQVALVVTSPPYGPTVHGLVRPGADGVAKFDNSYNDGTDKNNLAYRDLAGLVDGFTDILRGCHTLLKP